MNGMLLHVVVVGAVLVLRSTASAWVEPDNFRGTTWGASEEQLRQKEQVADCFDLPENIGGGKACGTQITIGSVPVTAIYVFRDGKFVRVTLSFEPKDFDDLSGIFSEKYGKPTKTEKEEGQTQGGAKFLNVTHVWEGSRVYIMLT